jgi:hypothetical protein
LFEAGQEHPPCQVRASRPANEQDGPVVVVPARKELGRLEEIVAAISSARVIRAC